MAFLAPLFLAGLAAIALPILLHLRKNRPKQTVAFSSLMFLEASPLVTKRRARIQDILLLILRCLALALLAFAFARPFLPATEKPAAAAEGAVLNFLLIDTSASMRGAPMQKALAEAEKIIASLPEKHWIAVGTFSGKFRPLVSADRARELSPSERKPAAKAALSTVTAGWESTVLDSALLAAVASVDEGIPLKIHLIGDFQKDQTVERLATEVWSDNVQVIPHPISPEGAWTNAGLHILPRDDEKLRVRIVNSQGSAKSDFSLKWSGIETPQNLSVPPGESGVFEAPESIAAEGKVNLTGDGFTFDNEASWVAKARPLASIWYPDEASATDPEGSLYFLARAMTSTPDYEVEIVSEFPDPLPALAISGGNPGDTSIAKLRDFITKGGTGLFTMDSTGSASSLAQILGEKSVPAAESAVSGHSRFGEINFESPVFAPFADARYSDFSSIRIWKYRILPPALTALGTVAASFDSGDPAWIVFPLGKGSLHVLTTTWRPADSQLALTTKFPPLLHSLLIRAADSIGQDGPLFVGDTIPLPTPIIAEAPGIFREGDAAFAVQLDPTESELTPVSDLKSLNLPLNEPGDSTTLSETTTRLSNIEQERQQKWGWWLVIAAAAFFLAETIVGHASRLSRPAGVPPAVHKPKSVN